MLISHKHKFVSIDIPKTGTRSLRESLCPLGIIDVIGLPESDEFYQHSTAEQLQKQFVKNNWEWNDYFTFTIIRNPWERFFSLFNYYKNYAKKFKNKDPSIIWDTNEIKQGEFCLELFQEKNPKTIMVNLIMNNRPQHDYYMINKKIAVKKIFLFENLNSEFEKLCKLINIENVTLKHENKSELNEDLEKIMDDDIINLIGTKEKITVNLMKSHLKL